MNLGDKFEVEHETVCHNQRFVNPDRIPKYVDRLGKEVLIKVHSNTIERY